jgi:HSP20 family molecular chaperone IbpA
LGEQRFEGRAKCLARDVQKSLVSQTLVRLQLKPQLKTNMKMYSYNTTTPGFCNLVEKACDSLPQNRWAGLQSLAKQLAQLGHLSSGEVKEDADAFRVSLDLPGVKKEGLKMELQDGVIQIQAERTRPLTEEKFTYSRTVEVPLSVAEDRIQAKLEDGVLILTLPKREERKPRNIALAES